MRIDVIRRCRVLAVLVLVALGLPLRAQEALDVPDASVEAQMAAFEVAEGFEINLFASDPMIAKPIQMNWDSAGRLWVVSSATYPHIEPGAEDTDQVLILEDGDGDGTADKMTVFADDLHIPTGVMPMDGGVYLSNSTEVLFLRDRDGDGASNERTVLLSGIGTEDTHHLLHTFRFGADGVLYFNQSIYIHSHIETPHGIRRLAGGGIWRFRPETRELDVISKGLVNPWGHIFDEWGQEFATDGAGFEGINYIFPGSVFRTSPGEARFLPGLNPGQPKHCGLEVVSGRHFPEEWQGHLIAPDFRGNRVNRFEVRRDGSGYVSAQQEDVVTSTHRAFRPIDVRMGPDGALYIADWYNPIIQHGEVDFRDARRDRSHGRIWRVTAKDRPLVEAPMLEGAGVRELLEALKAPEGWTREMARRELRLHDSDEVLRRVNEWEATLDGSEARYEHHLLEGLWACQAVDRTNESLIRRLVESEQARVRAAALRVLSYRHDDVPEAEALLAAAVDDEDAQVRLEAVTGLRMVGTVSAMGAAMGVLNYEMDENLDFALWAALREHEELWMDAVREGELTLEDGKKAVFAMRAVGRGDLLPGLMDGVESGEGVEGLEGEIVALAGEVGDSEGLARIFGWMAGDSGVSPELRGKILESLEEAARLRKLTPSGDVGGVVELMGDGDEAVARAAARLAGLWKVGMARERLKAILVADEGSDALLRDVAVALGGFRGPGQGEVFREMIQEGVSGRTARMAVIGALTMNPKVGAEMAAEVLAGLEDARESGALITALLANKQTPKLLAQALNGKTIPQGVARQLVQKAQSSGMQVDALVAAVKKAGNLKPMVQQLSPEAMAAMVGLVRTEGDAHRGEKVYRRVEMQCAVCHAIGETGGLVGPNLVSLGASAPEDYLIESMLEPSKKVKEGYHMTMVTTKGGDIFSGGLVSESGQEIVIRDAAGLERVIPTGDVAQKQTSPVSMMPPGLTVSLREDEFIDLIRFLSELGKEGDFKTPPNRYVRHWEVVVPTLDIRHDMGFYGLPFFTRADAELDWRPVSSTVAGYLEGAEMPTISGRLKGRPGKVTFGVGRFFLEGEAGAKAVLGLENAEGVSLVVNGEEIEGAERIEVEVVDGKTPVVVVVNKEAAGTPVRIELLDSGGEVKLASRPVP